MPAVYTSPYPAPAVPRDLSVAQFLVRSNPDDVPPDRTVVRDFARPAHRLSYGELRARAAQGAASLQRRLGVRPGRDDVVALVGRNTVNWLLLAHCVLWAGACVCGISADATAHELVYAWRAARPAVVAVDAALLPAVRRAVQLLQDEAPAVPVPVPVPQLIVIEDGAHNDAGAAGLLKFPRDFIQFQFPSVAAFDLGGRDNASVAAAICFSSGTSGLPKAVQLSHHGLIATLLSARASNPLANNAHAREVFYPPFAHIYGLVAGVLSPAWLGNTVTAMPRFALDAYLRRCAADRATVLRLVPATATRLAKDPAVRAAVRAGTLDLASVRTVLVAGAALAPATVAALAGGSSSGRGSGSVLTHPDGVAVLNGYGMTEAMIAVLREPHGQTRAGSLGRVAAGMRLRIVDVADPRRDVPVGTPGQCLVQGPTLFLRYKGDPAATAAAFVPAGDADGDGGDDDRWFCTGDVVRLDADGFLWMTGRLKELIKVRGHQVAPAELEAVLLQHPLVADAGVCGVADPDDAGGECPLAAVTLVPAAADAGAAARSAALGEIRAFLDARVAPYKRLRAGLVHLDALPKGPTGKLQRSAIAAAVAAAAAKKEAKL